MKTPNGRLTFPNFLLHDTVDPAKRHTDVADGINYVASDQSILNAHNNSKQISSDKLA